MFSTFVVALFLVWESYASAIPKNALQPGGDSPGNKAGQTASDPKLSGPPSKPGDSIFESTAFWLLAAASVPLVTGIVLQILKKDLKLVYGSYAIGLILVLIAFYYLAGEEIKIGAPPRVIRTGPEAE